MAFRAFVGVPIGPLPPLVRLVDALAASGADLKLVDPETLHLTLSFLGQVDDERQAAIERAIDEATAGVAAFTSRFQGVGAFPNVRRPRVVWVGIADAKPMVDLALRVRERLAEAGFAQEERDFRAHVTLARARDERGDARVVPFLQEHGRDEPGDLTVDRVQLYRSRLGPKGPAYDVLHAAKLEA